jgi:thioredoxin 1
MEITQRILISVLILGGGFGLYRLVNMVVLSRVRGRKLGLESITPGVPAILYFTTPTCVPCKTVQRPALEKVTGLLEDQVQVIEVDCTERPELAEFWGVLSVPTTFIIDGSGQPRQVNHGVTRSEKLLAQLRPFVGQNSLPQLVRQTPAPKSVKIKN